MSFAVILPFLKPIRHLLQAETVSEIMINPDSSIWIEEDKHIQALPGVRFEEGALLYPSGQTTLYVGRGRS